MAEDQAIKAAVTTDATSRGLRVKRVGVVTSDGRDKTIRVEFSYSTRHAKYGKTIKRRTVFHAHDEKNEAKVGDTVEIVECRPVSKSKSWRLVNILRKGEGGPV